MHTSTFMTVIMASLAVASPIAKRDYVIDWTIKTVDVTITAGQPIPTPSASVPQAAAQNDPPSAQASPVNAPDEFFNVPAAQSKSTSAQVAAPPSPTTTPSTPSSSSISGASPGGTVNNVPIDSLLTKHNDYRSQHSAGALSWAQCVWQHSRYVSSRLLICRQMLTRDSADERSAGNYGQNMFASTEQDATAIGTTVDSWYSEYTLYPFSSPPQTMDEAWGHFSQLVWKRTSTVGCANYYCDTMKDPSGNVMDNLHSFIICNYQNPGK
jgi:hypothetical protein